ncbi:MAG: MopE-related protein [Myxococcota bacterium]
MKPNWLSFAAVGFALSACSSPQSSNEHAVGRIQQALPPSSLHELKPSGDLRGPANFGWSAATDGARVLIGANRVGDSVGSEGAAYVFEKQPNGEYSQVARLRANEAPQAAQFGYSLALSGNRALIGAPYLDRASLANPGAAYVFERNGSGVWAQAARLDGPAQPNAYQGYAVALGGDRAVVGSFGVNKVYVFERSAGSWTLQSTVFAPDVAPGDRFGAAVSLEQDRLLVGAPYAQSERGAVYVFELSTLGVWEFKSKITGSAVSERFGRSLALSGETALVGLQAAARLIKRDLAGNWSVQSALPAAPVGFDFGNSVAFDSSRALVGAYLQDDPPRSDNGAAYLFTRNPNGSFAEDRFIAPVLGSTDYFGYSVALRGNIGVVGAYGDDDQAANGGAAYVVDLPLPVTNCGPGTKCERRRALLPCATYRLSASQTVTQEDDLIELGSHDFGRTADFVLPNTIRLTSAAAGSYGFLFFRDADRKLDVRCRYSPPNSSATVWNLDGCKIPRAGVTNAVPAGTTVHAREVRFRLGGGDSLERGTRVAGDIDLVESGSCNQFSMENCTLARSTATRFNANAERFENARLDANYHFAIPTSVPFVGSTPVAPGQTAELAFWSGSTRTASCTYSAASAGASSLTFVSCKEPGVTAGSIVTSNRVVLRLLQKGFQKGPLSARVELTPQDAVCVTPSQDDDGDGIPTANELAASSALGVADADADGNANWRDSDANGNGVGDAAEATDADADAVDDYIDVPCEPSTFYADADGDGFGDPATAVVTCPAPAGYVENSQDCADSNAAINPDASEACGDLIDNDCDAVADEACNPPACTQAVTEGEGTLLSQLQAGHGFSANAGGSHDLNDVVDFALGTQSAWIETNAAGTAKTLKRTSLGSFDFTGKMPRLWVKLDSVTAAATLQLYLGSNNLADHYKFAFESTQGQQWTTEGDWVAFSMSWSAKHVSTVGSPNRAAITDVQLRAIDENTGTPVKLHANQISMVDEPAEYPNGLLSITFDDGFASQFSLAKPILDTYGYPATAYVIVGVVGAPNYMTLAELTTLQNSSNWEIAYHSYDADVHTAGFPSTPALDLEQDIDLARDWLYDNGFEGHCDCAYPHGAFTGGATDVLSTVAARLSACRTVHQKHREAYPPSNPYKLRVLLVNKPVTVESVELALDRAKANKEWLILVFHNLTDTPVINNDYDPDDFGSIMAYANSIGIPVQTVGDTLALP